MQKMITRTVKSTNSWNRQEVESKAMPLDNLSGAVSAFRSEPVVLDNVEITNTKI